MTSIWFKYDKNCFLCKSSQKIAQTKITKNAHKPSNAQKAKRLQATPKSTNAHKDIGTRKPPKTKQKNHAQKKHKNLKTPQKTPKPP